MGSSMETTFLCTSDLVLDTALLCALLRRIFSTLWILWLWMKAILSHLSNVKKPATPIPQSSMLNGSGHSLVSPPTSPGTLSVSSSYENTSPPFSPRSTPSVVSSPGACLDSTNTRSTSYTPHRPGPGATATHFCIQSQQFQRRTKGSRKSQASKSLDWNPLKPSDKP